MIIWIQQNLNSKSEGKTQQLRDPLPFLPIQRPQELTPPSSSGERAQSPLSNSGLFGILPYELRRKILVEAFGNRTLHVDLNYSHPLVRRSAASTEGAAKQTRTPQIDCPNLTARSRFSYLTMPPSRSEYCSRIVLGAGSWGESRLSERKKQVSRKSFCL